MGYSNWDSGHLNDDGTITGNWYIVDVDYANCYAIFNAEPVGDKYQLQGLVALEGKNYVVKVNGATVCSMPTDWTQLPAAVKSRGPLTGEVGVKWRAYDNPQRFMVNLSLKNA